MIRLSPCDRARVPNEAALVAIVVNKDVASSHVNLLAAGAQIRGPWRKKVRPVSSRKLLAVGFAQCEQAVRMGLHFGSMQGPAMPHVESVHAAVE
jgi:hypothetical protein